MCARWPSELGFPRLAAVSECGVSLVSDFPPCSPRRFPPLFSWPCIPRHIPIPIPVSLGSPRLSPLISSNREHRHAQPPGGVLIPIPLLDRRPPLSSFAGAEPTALVLVPSLPNAVEVVWVCGLNAESAETAKLVQLRSKAPLQHHCRGGVGIALRVGRQATGAGRCTVGSGLGLSQV